MKVSQLVWTEQGGWSDVQPALEQAQLVIAFGGIQPFGNTDWMSDLKAVYPEAAVFGCSTAGEIAGTDVNDDSIVATAIQFDTTTFQLAVVALEHPQDSRDAGGRLATLLHQDGLAHVFVLSDGQHVNGSELVRGLAAHLPEGVQVTGGLAGDGGRFEQTFIVAGDTLLTQAIAAIGFYGDAIQVGYGSLGGWDPFGPLRTITRSDGNVLYELDGKSALDLYKSYLGEHAAGLPATALLFPLQIQREGDQGTLVRSILNVDEQAGSLTFAGDVPVGATVQLMKTNFDNVVQAASSAALASTSSLPAADAELALLVSCVGRKMVLKQRIEEEVEAVQSVLGPSPVITGFYSYGEICPSDPDSTLQLHNQTMTITTLSER